MLGIYVLPVLAATASAAPAAATWWKPAASTTWNIALSVKPTTFSANKTVYDLDLFDTANSTIASLKASGHKVICYYSAGTYEEWRPDASQFPASAKGNNLADWPGERWIDTRDATIRTIMANRINLAKAKGCDGLDPDNIDGYENKPGFPLTTTTATDYVNYLTNTAHNLGLASGLKNGGAIVSNVVGNVDWEVNEQCAQYKECSSYSAFIKANKPVFQIEYTAADPPPADFVTRSCNAAGASGFSTLLKHLSLNTWTAVCPSGAVVPF